jgi:hypothetical protein
MNPILIDLTLEQPSRPVLIDLTLEPSKSASKLKIVFLSPAQKLQQLLDAMCIDIQRYIESYLQLPELRKYCIYTKFSNYQKCVESMNVFTAREINEHFHVDDYYGMSCIKSKTIKDYLRFNLMSIYFPTVRLIDNWHIIQQSWYINLRKIMICSKYRTLRNAHRLKQIDL